ncbi:uncharacterized protein BT62DRAFT_50846 [Guyanagaster necrorhizus]|uniref:Shugoshin C-terminal domain-containing protein n=1 Tax=Guyanagaster necrorhizus TaxID=856835 RepID=A0A9P7W659_9AGAR|nr:uncharacterized protein BT62DRAFT_50846 [Guyanagaster necrorhizus MCA 3950]KAG7453190.1 hypothetical protein BT62DRAFT_50846 [Guyanagaster necrorhizus MCA 3950]
MSRRESRASTGARQNDALFEFENFKKKFLQANKQITKLNSTMSVRIEELNAQISTLYNENLRLRASEIALSTELKRERQKSGKVMAEVEIAALGLTKHLSFLRHTFDIQQPSVSRTPLLPRATRRPSSTTSSSSPSPTNRLSKPPDVPGICEEEEPSPTSEEEQIEVEKPPSPRRKVKTKPRLSASKLPLPSRIASPPPMLDLSSTNMNTLRKKAARRQSGLLTVNVDMVHRDQLSIQRPVTPILGMTQAENEACEEEEEEEAAVYNGLVENVDEEDVGSAKVKKEKRRKYKDKDDVADTPCDKEIKSLQDEDGDLVSASQKLKFKDVTNSPRRRATLPETDSSVDNVPGDSGAPRQFLVSSPSHTSHLLTPHPSSPTPPPEPESDTGGRERRVRKSVNYAEPKLNTKMRKPDPATGNSAPKKRASASAALATPTYKIVVDDTVHDADNDTEARSSVEHPCANGTAIDPAQLPLPPSRPSSKVGQRKRSRPPPVLDDEDDDGADADAEYIPAKGLVNGWVNDGKRRQGARRAGLHDEETRRHSLVV